MTDPTQSSDREAEPEVEDEGPGLMPAVVASVVLLGIIFFVSCPFLTMFLFQQRTNMAIRTLRGSYVGQIEQSLLEPDSKSAVIKEVKLLIADMERGDYENWQSAGIMERLQRLPVVQWGELQAVEAFLQKSTGEEAERAASIGQLSRVRRAVDQGSLNSFDVDQILQPIREPDPFAVSGSRLVQPLAEAQVAEVVELARQAADRAEIPDQDAYEIDIEIESLVRRAIERGAREGDF